MLGVRFALQRTVPPFSCLVPLSLYIDCPLHPPRPSLFRSSHISSHLSSSYLISFQLMSHHITSSHLTYFNSSHLNSSHLTSPQLTSPHLISPHVISYPFSPSLFSSSLRVLLPLTVSLSLSLFLISPQKSGVEIGFRISLLFSSSSLFQLCIFPILLPDRSGS